MSPPPTENETQRKRRFKIQSEFGNARKWRSRKNRPCDICRRRKTACVIEDRPPCLFCRGRGLDCQSTHDSNTVRDPASQSPEGDDEQMLSLEQASDVDLLEHHEQISPVATDPGERPFSLSADVGQVDLRSEHMSVVARTPTTSLHFLGPEIRTLEDNKDKTAHSIGPSAEQDTNLLASFRSTIINEIDRVAADILQVHPGDLATGTPPVHFYLLSDHFMPYDDHIKSESLKSIEFKVGPYGPQLIRLFFKHVHPVYCVVSKVRFLRAYKEDRSSIPTSLLGVIYGLACVYWNQDPELRTIPRPFEQYELFQPAQASLERELEAPNLWKMQSCLLILHEKAAGNGVFETPRTWTMSVEAVGAAQIVGLHRDPSDWNIAPWEKSLRKKLWWATYMTDMWASVSHGNPPHIYQASFTTSDLDMDDLRFDEDVPEELSDMVDITSVCFDISTAARFIELVKLTQILHNLLDTAFSDKLYRIAILDLATQEERLWHVQSQLESWHSMVPQCVIMSYTSNRYSFRNNGPLHLAYFATQVLLWRALMTPASMSAKTNPHSSLRRFFGPAMEQISCFLTFMNEITLDGSRAFWGRHARSQLILIGNFLIYLFLLSSGHEQVRSTFRLLELFHASLQRMGELVNEESVGLIRPVALRIDSFFTQAAQMMRGSVTSSYTDGINMETPP